MRLQKKEENEDEEEQQSLIGNDDLDQDLTPI